MTAVQVSEMGFDLDKEQRGELRRIGIENDIRQDNVDRIIDMKSPQPPKRSFDIEVSSQTGAVNKIYLGASLSGLAGDAVLYFVRRGVSGDNGGLLELVLGIVFIAVGLLSLVVGSRSAHVSGEELIVSGKSCFAAEIEKIVCKGVDVRVLCGGKTVLRLKKTDKGCDELIKLARAYDIAIENSDGEPSRGMKILIAVGAVLFIAAFTGLLFFIVTKM